MTKTFPYQPIRIIFIFARAALISLGIACAISWSSIEAGPRLVRPPAELTVSLNSAEAIFLEKIRFRLIASNPSDIIERVRLFYSLNDSPVLQEILPEFQAGKTISAEFHWPVRQTLLPGSEITYFWRVDTADGDHWTTGQQQISYDDTRFDWTKTAEGLTNIYSYGLSETIRDELTKETRNVLALLRKEYSLSLERAVKVFVYANQQDYVSALAPLQVVSPGLTVGTNRIFMVLTDQPDVNAKTIRHEVLHAVFLQQTRNAFNDPPRWLTEGFSMFLAGDEIHPENLDVLRKLEGEGRLFSLKSLSGGFPTTEQDLAIAYLESYSAVRYIIEEFGPEKLNGLLSAIKLGNTTDNAFTEALGLKVDDLDQRWRGSLKRGDQSRPSAAPRAGVTFDSLAVEENMLSRTVDFWSAYLGPLIRPVSIGIIAAISIFALALVISSIQQRNRRDKYD